MGVLRFSKRGRVVDANPRGEGEILGFRPGELVGHVVRRPAADFRLRIHRGARSARRAGVGPSNCPVRRVVAPRTCSWRRCAERTSVGTTCSSPTAPWRSSRSRRSRASPSWRRWGRRWPASPTSRTTPSRSSCPTPSSARWKRTTKRAREFFGIIHEAAERMRELVAELLGFSRPRGPEAAFAVHDLLKRIIRVQQDERREERATGGADRVGGTAKGQCVEARSRSSSIWSRTPCMR